MSKGEELFNALRDGNLSRAESLIKEVSDAELCYISPEGYSILSAAIEGSKWGQISYDFIEDLVNNKLPHKLFKHKDCEGNSPLLEILDSSPVDYKIARLIFDKNPKAVNDVNKEWQTALSMAISLTPPPNHSDNIELIKLLLNYSEAESILNPDKKGNTLLHKAAMLNNYQVVKTLSELNLFKSLLNYPNDSCLTPLELAIAYGYSDLGLNMITLLISSGAVITKKSTSLWNHSKLNSRIELADLVSDQNKSSSNNHLNIPAPQNAVENEQLTSALVGQDVTTVEMGS